MCTIPWNSRSETLSCHFDNHSEISFGGFGVKFCSWYLSKTNFLTLLFVRSEKRTINYHPSSESPHKTNDWTIFLVRHQTIFVCLSAGGWQVFGRRVWTTETSNRRLQDVGSRRLNNTMFFYNFSLKKFFHNCYRIKYC